MKKTLVIFLLLFIGLNAQSRSNFDKINLLIDKSLNEITSQIEVNDLKLNLASPDQFRVLENRIKSVLKNGKSFSVDIKSSNVLNYSLSEVKTEYGEAFTESLFGDVLSERIIKVKGSYSYAENSNLKKADMFNYSSKDTLKYDNLFGVENSALPFTQGEKPDEPIFSSLTEPIVAIGTAIVTVVLFFTVRSN